MLKAILILFLCVISGKIQAQQDPLIRDLVENLAESLSEDYDLSELAAQLAAYKKHPIDLNKTTAGELKNLVFLSPLQISNFFTHLNNNGKLLDLLELQAIDAFDLATIQKLLPFVTLNAPTDYVKLSFKNLITNGNSDLILRYSQTLQKKKGFRDLPGSRYLGSPEKLLGKYKYSFSDVLAVSIVVEKDAGEYLFAGNNKTSFDFISGSLAFYKLGRLKKFIIGDYSLQFGQGLTLWSGFGFGKGPDVSSVAKKDVGLKPYTSANESSFFRGLSGTVNLLKNIDLTTFISYRKLDASQSLNPDGTLTQVNIGISGLHRTKTEIRNKNDLGQLVYGGVLQYISNNLNIGIMAYQSQYDHEFVTGTQHYNAYGFTGKKLTNTGLHYNYTFQNIYFYGEIAKSLNGGISLVNGAMTSLSSWLSVVIVHRNYDKNYHSFLAQGIGEGSDASNEGGFYAGLNINLNKRWNLSAYSDYFKFPWLKYRVDDPSSGYELFGQVSYTPSKTFKIAARFKTGQKQQNTDVVVPIKYLDQVNKKSYRIELKWQLNRKLSFQNRAEVAQYQKGTAPVEFGYLIYQDADYSPLSSRLTANIRLAYFNTPSYNSRIYAYEDDVLYGFSFGMYNGKGFRTYLNLKYKLLRKLDIWTRYALFKYQDVETVGSGLDEIEGSKKSEIKVQLRYKF